MYMDLEKSSSVTQSSSFVCFVCFFNHLAADEGIPSSGPLESV